MILVFTQASDLGADLVIRHLARRELVFRRINTEHLGTRDRHIAFLDGQFVLVEPKGRIEAGSVAAMWMRRFARPATLEQVDERYRGFATRELSQALDGFIATAGGLRINPPMAEQIAGNRLVQAMHAVEAGFLVPDSIVTQEPDEAIAFMARHRTVITKAISFGLLTGDLSEHAYTATVTPGFDVSGLTVCPALFQAFIPKRCEWRITTVGTQVFAARTRRDAQVDPVDWRQSPAAADIFEAASLPPEVERMLVSLCASCGLLFGTHDLIETPSGDFYFLETNPAGQWGWLEVRLGLPVGEALASLLASESPR